MSSDLIVREDGDANVCPDDRRSGILAAAAERDGEGILTGAAGSRVQRGAAPGVKKRGKGVRSDDHEDAEGGCLQVSVATSLYAVLI